MKKKKKFPKIIKHIKDFLTDESGKITKHNAFGIGVVGSVLGGFEGAEGHHHSTGYSPGSHTRSWSPSVPAGTYYTASGCAHSSGIVNGLYDANPSLNTSGYSASGSGTSFSTNLPTTSTSNQTFYLDCGSVSASINGHYSSMGSLSNASASVTHTSTHSNY